MPGGVAPRASALAGVPAEKDALASVPRTPPRAPPNARESGSLCAPKPRAPAADLSSDAGMALAESAS